MDHNDFKTRIESIIGALNEVSVKGYQNHAIMTACLRELMEMSDALTSAPEKGQD